MYLHYRVRMCKSRCLPYWVDPLLLNSMSRFFRGCSRKHSHTPTKVGASRRGKRNEAEHISCLDRIFRVLQFLEIYTISYVPQRTVRFFLLPPSYLTRCECALHQI